MGTSLTAGLLAGLYEPPTVPGTDLATGAAHVSTLLGPLKPLSHTSAGTVPHIFSHISRTYHVQHLVITGELPPAPDRAVWLGSSGVNAANIGTGVKKSWAAVYGAWGKFSK